MKSTRFILPNEEQYSLSNLSHVAITGDPRMASAFVKLLHYDPDYERATLTANTLYQSAFFHPTPQGFVFLGHTGQIRNTGEDLINAVCENAKTLKNIKIKAAIHFGMQNASYVQGKMQETLSLSPAIVESAAQGVLILGRILGLPVGKLDKTPEELAKDHCPPCLDATEKWPLVRAALAALPPPLIDCDPLSLHHILERYYSRSSIRQKNSNDTGGTRGAATQEVIGRTAAPRARTRAREKATDLARLLMPTPSPMRS